MLKIHRQSPKFELTVGLTVSESGGLFGGSNFVQTRQLPHRTPPHRTAWTGLHGLDSGLRDYCTGQRTAWERQCTMEYRYSELRVVRSEWQRQ